MNHRVGIAPDRRQLWCPSRSLLVELRRSHKASTLRFVTAFVFGVWRILPTPEGLSTNSVVGHEIVGFGMTLAVLGATAADLPVAGLALSWLAVPCEQPPGPFLAHVGTTTSYVAGASSTVVGDDAAAPTTVCQDTPPGRR